MLEEKGRQKNAVAILGTRGVPAQHGGFETFAEKLALYLVGRGWEVTVYCQEEGGGGRGFREECWEDITLVKIPVSHHGALGTVVFDWQSVRHAAIKEKLVLTLGYNTAIFSALYRVKGVKNLINMDGLEWQRDKWGMLPKAWLWLNERFGCWLGDHLIADHPSIKSHLATRVSERKITMVPYGGEALESVDPAPLKQYGLEPNRYVLVIARPEPENSIYEIIEAFSRKSRGLRLVVLGKYEKDNGYHRKVLTAASDEVLFPGAIYDGKTVKALRYHTRLYVHGHTVGGTNPSLVEALGAGSPVLAHDNRFNRWVAGSGAAYFETTDDCAAQFEELLGNDELLREMAKSSIQRHKEQFRWSAVLSSYEKLLLEWANI